MKQSLASLVGAGVLLAVAFAPPVVEAAEANENVHFGEHLMILVAGLLLAIAIQALVRRQFDRNPHRASLGVGIIGLGFVLFLASQIPAFDMLADMTMAFHVLQHLMILASGGLVGMGFIVFGAIPTMTPRSR